MQCSYTLQFSLLRTNYYFPILPFFIIVQKFHELLHWQILYHLTDKYFIQCSTLSKWMKSDLADWMSRVTQWPSEGNIIYPSCTFVRQLSRARFCKQLPSVPLNRRFLFLSLSPTYLMETQAVLLFSVVIFMSWSLARTHTPCLALGLSAQVITVQSLFWEQLVELYK